VTRCTPVFVLRGRGRGAVGVLELELCSDVGVRPDVRALAAPYKQWYECMMIMISIERVHLEHDLCK
jgi:hypothetical protein